MNQVQCHHAIQRLVRQFAESSDIDVKRSIRQRQKALLRQYPQVALTAYERFEIVAQLSEQVR